MRLGWIGFHQEGLRPFRAVLEAGVGIEAVVTLDEDVARRRSGAVDYAEPAARYGVPLHTVRDINDDAARQLLATLDLDLAFVIGWTQIVRRPSRELARLGMIGAHASLLPALRGRAPVNWAIIGGLRETGNTLFWLDDEADRGDVIDQRVIPISPYDTCASIYDKVAESTAQMIVGALPALLAGERPGRAQPAADGPDLPARRPGDGLVTWAQPASSVYDFVRALTRPYPGAFGWLDGRRWRIWESALLPEGITSGARPGTVLGPIVSPGAAACGLAVACDPGVLAVLELQDDDGAVLRGPALADRPWAGGMWSDHP